VGCRGSYTSAVRPPHVQRITLENFKSFAKCDVFLDPLTVLVGRNGSGKSNLLDAVQFTREALEQSLDYAVRERAGIDGVRRRSRLNRPTTARVELRVSLPGGFADYGYRLSAASGGRYEVLSERCVVRTREIDCTYALERGAFAQWTIPGRPQPADLLPDRLALPTLSGIPALRGVYDALTRVVLHNLSPDAMKEPARPSSAEVLDRRGSNIAAVVSAMPDEARSRLVRYLSGITGYEIQDVRRKSIGSYETIEIAQVIADAKRAWEFDAASVSDGTLRALGILASALSEPGDRGPLFIGIEEPENALHPAAAGFLVDALLEGAEHRQVVITTHSPSLIEGDRLDPSCLRCVVYEDGESKVGPLSRSTMELLKKHLYDPGELLRLDQLVPDAEDLERQQGVRSLFDEVAA